MKRTSHIFQVKTYDNKIKSELGGIGLYHVFGYTSDWLGDNILIFNSSTYDYKIMLKTDAVELLQYYNDEPIDIKEENKMIKQLNKIKELNIT